jgi:ferredoxin-NADP reductase/Na+-translocating ferredoxin:NAD+ oxidoreductase RnfD subunit
MYKLTLYYLSGLIAVAIGLSFAGILPYDPFALMFSTAFFITACWVTNTVFSKTFRVPANVESVYISALILALIVDPLHSIHDLSFMFWMAVLAMASKYILTINRKHIFNPVALAVALTALTIDQSASWWVGTAVMLPFVLIGGFLIIRKIRRFDLVLSFLLAALATTLALTAVTGENLITASQEIVLQTPLVFFAAIILTEPLTTPPTDKLRIWYGVLVGVLFSPQVHLGALYFTPELAILIGNVFSYLVSPKAKLVLRLKEKIHISPDVYDFIFQPTHKLSFAPGQYMEWTLGHDNPDSRGNRRYFTLASSPTEDNLRVGVKFYDDSSSYKESMLAMNADTEIVAGQLAGDFTLPRDLRQKCVFIAGGIGITPFRSMIKYLLDKRQRRPIVIFYVNRTVSDIVYRDVLDKAQQMLGIKTIHVLTDNSRVPTGWSGRVGYINARMLKTDVPDYMNCIFYVSGPNKMIESCEDVLIKMGVPRDHIKTDFFPGLV